MWSHAAGRNAGVGMKRCNAGDFSEGLAAVGDQGSGGQASARLEFRQFHRCSDRGIEAGRHDKSLVGDAEPEEPLL